MNNSSLLTADRTTHLKIVVVSLLASIVVMAVGIRARLQPPDGLRQMQIYKPAKSMTAAPETGPAMRSRSLESEVDVAGRGVIERS